MQKKKLMIVLTLLAALALSACGASDVDLTPTVDVELIRTQAVLTYQAQLTQTAVAMPTASPTTTKPPTPATPAGTFSAPTLGTPLATSQATIPVTGGGSSSACYGLSYVSDVTIPDGTQMTPGQSFTKTWRVSNTGTCAWEAGFTFGFVGGDAMSGNAVTLNQRVEPGSQFELSVPLVAPTNKTGEVQGNWRLSDANGSFFGDQVYVNITVGGGAAAPTNTTDPDEDLPTATPTTEE